MKPITPLLVTAFSLLAKAQYDGSITTENKGGCPIPIREGTDTKFSWDPEQGNLCIPLAQSAYYTEEYHASLIGYAATPDVKEPLKFGACSSAACDDCTLVDVRVRTDRPGTIESDCVAFTDAPYLYVGNGKGNKSEL
ncbi:hypothetical protein BDW59DRAFT_151589 [Aspergillus cavernicola]|uniref:Uncharacterized protein n=1 Tax=Aspergillus cavernicola TaxID=176166 RepID=A0ABR4HUX4_9EURO